jgi:ssDNA-binding Zn-finger/Zn-ribbon topoisomerase 1
VSAVVGTGASRDGVNQGGAAASAVIAVDGDGKVAGAGMVADGDSLRHQAIQGNTSLLGEAYKRIAAESSGPVDVLVLGRYRYLEQEFKSTPVPNGNIKARFSTVHTAKGAEADYVVILAVVSGWMGFPSEIADDPLLSFVLAQEEGFANAEERRLFYVALSRARRKAYVITDEGRMSAFIEEMSQSDYEGLVTPTFSVLAVPTCGKCRGGGLRSVQGQYGPFMACSHYPRCDGKCSECPNCGMPGLQQEDESFLCFYCNSRAAMCPKCKKGYLRHIKAGVSARTGKPYEEFWGCSSHKRGVPDACRYTQSWSPY